MKEEIAIIRKVFISLVVCAMVLGVAPAFGGTFAFISIDYPGATFTEVHGINDTGQLVGSYRDTGNVWHGFIKDGLSYTPIDYPGARATFTEGINDTGLIVGYYYNSDYTKPYARGFLKSGNSYTAFDYPGASWSTMGHGINAIGQIVGSYSINGTDATSFLKDGSDYIAFHYSAALGNTHSYNINSAGQIVGFFDNGRWSMGFLKEGPDYNGSDYNWIFYPGAENSYNRAYGINEAGQIVGGYQDGLGVHGFFKDIIIKEGGFYTAFDYPGAVATEAFGINNAGQIVGYYTDINGYSHGFLSNQTPVPLPGGLPLLGSGLLGLVGWRYIYGSSRLHRAGCARRIMAATGRPMSLGHLVYQETPW